MKIKRTDIKVDLLKINKQITCSFPVHSVCRHDILPACAGMPAISIMLRNIFVEITYPVENLDRYWGGDLNLQI